MAVNGSLFVLWYVLVSKLDIADFASLPARFPAEIDLANQSDAVSRMASWIVVRLALLRRSDKLAHGGARNIARMALFCLISSLSNNPLSIPANAGEPKVRSGLTWAL